MHQRVSIFASCLEMFLIKYSDEEAQPGPARRQSLQGMLEIGKNQGTQDAARSMMGVSTTCSRADVWHSRICYGDPQSITLIRAVLQHRTRWHLFL